MITVSQNYMKYNIPNDDIILLQSESNYTHIYTVNKKFLLAKTLKNLEEKIEDDNFIRINKGITVNKKHIVKITSKFVELTNGTVCVLSRRKIRALSDILSTIRYQVATLLILLSTFATAQTIDTINVHQCDWGAFFKNGDTLFHRNSVTGDYQFVVLGGINAIGNTATIELVKQNGYLTANLISVPTNLLPAIPPPYTDPDPDPANEIQGIEKSGGIVYLSQGGQGANGFSNNPALVKNSFDIYDDTEPPQQWILNNNNFTNTCPDPIIVGVGALLPAPNTSNIAIYKYQGVDQIYEPIIYNDTTGIIITANNNSLSNDYGVIQFGADTTLLSTRLYADKYKLPTQTGNTGKYLQTNGSTASWQTVTSGASGIDSIKLTQLYTGNDVGAYLTFRNGVKVDSVIYRTTITQNTAKELYIPLSIQNEKNNALNGSVVLPLYVKGDATINLSNANTPNAPTYTIKADTAIIATRNYVNTTGDPSSINEIQNLAINGTKGTISLSNSTAKIILADSSSTNEGALAVAGTTTKTITSNTTGSTPVTLTGAGIAVLSGTGNAITVTATEIDGSVTNEGSLTVGVGAANTSIINSNTSGQTGITVTAGTGLSISETGNVITLNNTGIVTEVDGSITNEKINSVIFNKANNILTINENGTNYTDTINVSASTPDTVVTQFSSNVTNASIVNIHPRIKGSTGDYGLTRITSTLFRFNDTIGVFRKEHQNYNTNTSTFDFGAYEQTAISTDKTMKVLGEGMFVQIPYFKIGTDTSIIATKNYVSQNSGYWTNYTSGLANHIRYDNISVGTTNDKFQVRGDTVSINARFRGSDNKFSPSLGSVLVSSSTNSRPIWKDLGLNTLTRTITTNAFTTSYRTLKGAGQLLRLNSSNLNVTFTDSSFTMNNTVPVNARIHLTTEINVQTANGNTAQAIAVGWMKNNVILAESVIQQWMNPQRPEQITASFVTTVAPNDVFKQVFLGASTGSLFFNSYHITVRDL